MATVNVHQAETHLSELLDRAAAGEQIVIARSGRPVAVLGPIVPSVREPGLLKGRVHIGESFDDPLSAGELERFRDGSVEPN